MSLNKNIEKLRYLYLDLKYIRYEVTLDISECFP